MAHGIDPAIFAVQQDANTRGALAFAKQKALFERVKFESAVSCIGGLLTHPFFQANTTRFEAIAHMAVAQCRGNKPLSKQLLATWFAEADKHIGQMEDPIEDVFVGRIAFESGNYLLLEGISEANCYHAQHILNVTETMPNEGVFLELKRNIRALLIISHEVCVRSNLDAFEIGVEIPHKKFPFNGYPTLKTLAKRVVFSTDQLRDLGVESADLLPFVLSDENYVTATEHMLGNSRLERQPIILSNKQLIVVLPSCLGLALRRYVIEGCIAGGMQDRLELMHGKSSTDQLLENSLIRSAGPPRRPLSKENPVSFSIPVEIDPGYWFHLVVINDNLDGYENGGLFGVSPLDSMIGDKLGDEITAVAEETRQSAGFKRGYTLVVGIGFGRGMATGLPASSDDWYVEPVSAYDIDVLGWMTDFDVRGLFKLADASRKLRSQGYELHGVNGLLNLVGWMIKNNGHLIPHEQLPDDMSGGLLLMGTNNMLDLRAKHHKRFDQHRVVDPDGVLVDVRRKETTARSHDGIGRVYVAIDHINSRRLLAVWHSPKSDWWVELQYGADDSSTLLYPIFEAICVWVERVGPVLTEAINDIPPKIFLKFKFDTIPQQYGDIVTPPEPQAILNSMRFTSDKLKKEVSFFIGNDFHHGLSHELNHSEAALARRIAEGVIELADFRTDNFEGLISTILGSEHARQLHAFHPQEFRDYVRDHVKRSVVYIDRIDDATTRLGLAQAAGLEVKAGFVEGKEACMKVLNSIVKSAENKLCTNLKRFERRAFSERVIANLEAAEFDRTWRYRTAKAVVELSGNRKEAISELSLQIQKLNAVLQACRTLLEIGICECPVSHGETLSDIELSALMAEAALIHHLGGESDAIRYEGMEPKIRISPAGEVQIDITFFEQIVDQYGSQISSRMLDDQIEGYSDLQTKPEVWNGKLEDILDRDFLNAWRAELGAPLADFRSAIEVIEDLGISKKKAWFSMTKSELVSAFNSSDLPALDLIKALASQPRPEWNVVPDPFVDADRQPWRFRRRLSVVQKPLLVLSDDADPEVLIAPGMVRDAFGSMLHNFHKGLYPENRLFSREMKRWSGQARNKQGHAFNKKVELKLQELGWSARAEINFSELLQRTLPLDPGDIDVLAWNEEGRILILECKDLQMMKTSSEIAQQLYKFRGLDTDRGKPDELKKHMIRVKLAQDNQEAIASYLGLIKPKLEHGLILSNISPLPHARSQISALTRVVLYKNLNEI